MYEYVPIVAMFVGPVGLADVVLLVEVVEIVETVEVVEIVEMLDVVDTVDFVLLVELDVVDGEAEEVVETAGCALPCNIKVIHPPSSLQIVT